MLVRMETEFKIGDEIETLDEREGLPKGAVGIVIDVKLHPDGWRYNVDFPDRFRLNLDSSMIRKVKTTAPNAPFKLNQKVILAVDTLHQVPNGTIGSWCLCSGQEMNSS
jgi:hypothetical protein